MYKLTKNIVAFQKNLVFLDDTHQVIEKPHLVMSLQAELMRFGYMLDSATFNVLSHYTKEYIVKIYDELIPYLRYITGGEHEYKPFWPGFPQQVMEMTEQQLWFAQMLYYWSNCTFQPEPWMEPYKVAFETTNYKMLSIADQKKFNTIFTDLVSVNQSLTPQDLEIVKWFIENEKTLVFPSIIPFKENLCTLAAMGIGIPNLTTTDVLRIAVHMSGGDTSLPAVPHATRKIVARYRSRYSVTVPNPDRDKFKFRKFTRKERKYLLGLLEISNCDPKEMIVRKERWCRLGEILHPGEYHKRFPKAAEAFNAIRDDEVTSWYSDVTKLFKKDYKAGLLKLSERPGEFARRLDALVRNNPAWIQHTLEAFTKVCPKISNKVLFELYRHFDGRDQVQSARTIMVKGSRKNTKLPELSPLSKATVTHVKICILTALSSKFAALDPLGKCWIDPELKKIPLPTNMRSLSESLVPIVRSQRTPMATEKKVIRPFIHWYDERGEEDLDLHGFLFGKAGAVSFGYNGIHRSEMGCYSGDVRYRRGACAEYVDINVDKAIASGYQYYVMVVHNFENRSLASMKDCVVGVQEREFPQANSKWLPETIVNSIRPQGLTPHTLIGMYDLHTREYIHLDLDWMQFNTYVSRSSSQAIFDAIAPYIELPKLSVYDLLSWHVSARGQEVEKEEAEMLFNFDDFKYSYVETLKYMGI